MTIEENLKSHLGNLIFQLAVMQTENQKLVQENAELKKQIELAASRVSG